MFKKLILGAVIIAGLFAGGTGAAMADLGPLPDCNNSTCVQPVCTTYYYYAVGYKGLQSYTICVA